MPRTVHDPVLGKLTWSKKYGTWQFNAGDIAGRPVEGVIYPSEPAVFPDKLWREIIVTQLQFVRDNEEMIRLELAKAALEWWEEMDYGPRAATESPEAFGETTSLLLMQFSDDGRVRLDYTMSHIMQHNSLWVELDKDCSIQAVVEEEGDSTEGP